MSDGLIRKAVEHIITGGIPIVLAGLVLSEYANVPITSTNPMTLENALVFGATIFVSGVVIQFLWDGLVGGETDE